MLNSRILKSFNSTKRIQPRMATSALQLSLATTFPRLRHSQTHCSYNQLRLILAKTEIITSAHTTRRLEMVTIHTPNN